MLDFFHGTLVTLLVHWIAIKFFFSASLLYSFDTQLTKQEKTCHQRLVCVCVCLHLYAIHRIADVNVESFAVSLF